MKQLALRTALIWHDEVMADVILEEPKPITLGRTGRATFTIPEVGLPQEFAIVRPGNRGYLLTLGERMRGKIHIDGETKDVADFVARGEGEDLGNGAGGFRATSISEKDWGVIDLDESGHYKLWFQFVPITPSQLTPHADMLSTLMSTAALAVVGMLAFMVTAAEVPFLQDNTLAEWAFRSIGLIPVALFIYGLGFSFLFDTAESQASYGFSAMLHGALLAYVVTTWPKKNPYKFPGEAENNANYIISRIKPDPPPEPPKSTMVLVKDKVASKGGEKLEDKPKAKEKQNTATKGLEGKSGGEGKRERKKDPNAKDQPEPPKVALLDDNNVKHIEATAARTVDDITRRFAGIKGDKQDGDAGFGTGRGTGLGTGIGTGTKTDSTGKGGGAGGNHAGDHKTTGKIDTGKDRPASSCQGEGCTTGKPKEVAVAIGGGAGDFNGYTEDEIRRVIARSAGLFKACYQKELNRTPGLSGNMTVTWKIGPEGAVLSAGRSGGTLSSAAVQGCVVTFVMKLKFPPKGVNATVTYPFVFTQSGG